MPLCFLPKDFYPKWADRVHHLFAVIAGKDAATLGGPDKAYSESYAQQIVELYLEGHGLTEQDVHDYAKQIKAGLREKKYIPTVAEDEDEGKKVRYTQVLQIEIDGAHRAFHGYHTPGILEVLDTVVTGLKKVNNIQVCTYPIPVLYGIDVVGQVDLVEVSIGEEETEEQEAGETGVSSPA